jgi:sarcosine oxidase gamma subunit
MTDRSADGALFGQVMAELAAPALTEALRHAGIVAEPRESAYPAARAEIRVHRAAGVECLLEQVAPAEYLVRDASGTLDALRNLAEGLSAALTGLGVRHRLEVYADDDSLAAYFHHQYPHTG